VSLPYFDHGAMWCSWREHETNDETGYSEVYSAWKRLLLCSILIIQ
jgi:hypothetical protein